MTTTDPSPATLQRVGAGLLLGAPVLAVLAVAVLFEVAALALVAAGMAVYALERATDSPPGVSIGLAATSILFLLDRELDPVGATLSRSAAATVAIAIALVAGALLLERRASGPTGDSH